MESQRMPDANPQQKMSKEQLLYKNFTEIIGTERTFCEAMKQLTTELKALEAKNLGQSSDADKVFLAKLIELVEPLSKSPLLDEPEITFPKNPTDKQLFDVFNQIMNRFSSDEFAEFTKKMGEYALHYDFINKSILELNEKLYSGDKQKLNNENLKITGLCIQPVQRGPRWRILLEDSKNRLNEIKKEEESKKEPGKEPGKKWANFCINKITPVLESVKVQVKEIDDGRALNPAYLDSGASFAHKHMLNDLDELIKKRYRNKFVDVDLLAQKEKSTMPDLKSAFEKLRNPSEDEIKNKIKLIKKDKTKDAAYNAAYNALTRSEKLLHKALLKLDKLENSKEKDPKAIKRHKERISNLVKFILLVHKKANLTHMISNLKAMENDINFLINKKNVLLKTDFTEQRKKSFNEIQGSYAAQMEAINKEISQEEAKLKKSAFVKQSLKEIKHEKTGKLEKKSTKRPDYVPAAPTEPSVLEMNAKPISSASPPKRSPPAIPYGRATASVIPKETPQSSITQGESPLKQQQPSMPDQERKREARPLPAIPSQHFSSANILVRMNNNKTSHQHQESKNEVTNVHQQREAIAPPAHLAHETKPSGFFDHRTSMSKEPEARDNVNEKENKRPDSKRIK